jgi:hypothetical protein
MRGADPTYDSLSRLGLVAHFLRSEAQENKLFVAMAEIEGKKRGQNQQLGRWGNVLPSGGNLFFNISRLSTSGLHSIRTLRFISPTFTLRILYAN